MKEQIAKNNRYFVYCSMKKLKNIMLTILIITTILIVAVCGFYNYNLMPVKNSSETVKIEIPKGSSSKNIASILKKNKLIRNEKVFLIYVKLMKKSNMNYGYYEIPYNSGVKKIVNMLQETNTYNPDEIKLTFKEGINMRSIATIISENTNNSYDSVIEKSNDVEYIKSLIDKYWFITNDVLNNELYYKLEGYLFPNTYIFKNKDVSVEEIFNKMIAEMAKVLEPLKSDINKNSLSIHQLLSLASMVEKEAALEKDRSGVASVFLNRMKLGMSLGSDVTTRYAVKVDNAKQVLTKVQYATKSPYNTRLTDGSMNGKLPVGPISTVSESSIKASLYPDDTNNIYFIANIKTLETFFFEKSSDFEKKKVELSSVNGGL